jgi:hypothetical protein
MKLGKIVKRGDGKDGIMSQNSSISGWQKDKIILFELESKGQDKEMPQHIENRLAQLF